MIQETSRKEFKGGQVRKCFNRKSNEHLTQSHGMKNLQLEVKLTLFAWSRYTLIALHLSWPHPACDVIPIFCSYGTPRQVTNERHIFFLQTAV